MELNMADRIARITDSEPPNPPAHLKVVCAWCPDFKPEQPPADGVRVSHGICPACAEKMHKELGRR